MMDKDTRLNLRNSQHWDDFKKFVRDYMQELNNLETIADPEEFTRRKAVVTALKSFIAEAESDPVMNSDEDEEQTITVTR